VSHPLLTRPLRRVVECLDEIGVPFFVAGSVASVLHGETRTTQDADLVVDLEEHQVAPLVQALKPEFYVDEAAVREAVRRRSSCNAIHLDSAFKIDLFVRRDRPHSREEMARRERINIAGVSVPVATAEDCVLTKLEWYEKGGRVSDRQWRDILGVLKTRRDAMDTAYLRRWAGDLGVGESLERALADAGLAS
jgi:hypothetical protein